MSHGDASSYLRGRAARAAAFARAHPARVVETTAAFSLLALLLWSDVGTLVRHMMAVAFGYAVASVAPMLADDPWPSVLGLALMTLKLALAAAPAARFFVHARARRVWAPLFAVVFFVCVPMFAPSISTGGMWVLLLVASIVGWLAAPRPRFRAAAFLPMLLAPQWALSHSPLGDAVWTPARLASRCARNDGVRPAGFERYVATRFFGVTRYDDDTALLTGERADHAFWLRRGADGRFAFAAPSEARGNYWHGCRLGDDLWLSRRNRVARVRPPTTAAPERLQVVRSPPNPAVGHEFDLEDAICVPETRSVFVGELIGGAIREISVDDLGTRYHPLGGFHQQLARRPDGKLAVINSARLRVFDPVSQRVLSERAAGFLNMGVAACATDGEVAVADFLGRVRLYRPDGDGYVFRGGVDLPAPRRVAFSPDCALLVVTSANDESLFVLRRADLALQRELRLGPALREIEFVRPRELLVADACTMTTVDLMQ